MIPCICIDNSNKPASIPDSHWLVKGEIYNVTDIRTLTKQNNILAVQLHEIDLTELSDNPENIQYFKLSRFMFTAESIILLHNLMLESHTLCKLDNVNILDVILNQSPQNPELN